ncbi:sigma-E processing peptidase SpoIIGA [Paenibacillus sediminis]
MITDFLHLWDAIFYKTRRLDKKSYLHPPMFRQTLPSNLPILIISLYLLTLRRFESWRVSLLVVYLDLIFITNLLIDGTLLFITAWMRKQKPNIWRILIASVVGALYVVMMFVPELSFMFTIFIKFALSVMMIWIAFGFGSLQNYARNMGAFYIVNFAAAGGILGIHYFMQSSSELFNGIWFSQSGGLSFELKMSFWFVFIMFFIVIFWFKAVHSSRRKKEQMLSFAAQVRVRIDGEEVECTGLIDTGNQLTDPLTRTPVMVMESILWEAFLPAAWQGKLAKVQPDNLIMELPEGGFPWQDRLRLVPYRGINKGTQFMLALKPDEVVITMDGKSAYHSKVLIGLDGGKLSAEGAYQAIIHPALIENMDQGESITKNMKSHHNSVNVL